MADKAPEGVARAAPDAPAPWRVLLEYARLTVAAECTQPGELPPFLGNALRGAFGHALRAGGCVAACGNTHHAPECAYADVFEPAPHPESLLRAQEAVAPAFVFVPEAQGPIEWLQGDVLRFDWVLFGPALARLPLLVTALEHALEGGLGMQRPARFCLKTVHVRVDGAALGLYVRHGTDRLLRTATPVEVLDIHPGPSAQGAVQIRFVTPLHLRSKGAMLRTLTFVDLAKALLMRTEAVIPFATVTGSRDARGLLSTARDVHILSSSLRQAQTRRWSNRQGRGIDFRGLVGECAFVGEVGPFLPLLDMAAQTHLGHGTAWGMGRIQWRARRVI